MQLKRLNLQNYRNIESSQLVFDGLYHYFLGKNGQGKTNILESIGLLAALRSFRTNDIRQLINDTSTESGLYYILEHEKLGETEILLRIKKGNRELRLNGEIVKRLSDFAGLFPAVVLCSMDMEMVRGAPSIRRRFMDQLISSVDPEYFVGLRNFQSALSSRNALLKSNATDMEIEAFEKILSPLAQLIFKKRKAHINQIEVYFEQAYREFAPESEIPKIKYLADLEIAEKDTYSEILDKNRSRDRLLKSTSRGPHRDDLDIRLGERKAKDFASEGQQRGLVSALRICQITYTREKTGVLPIILADDILGEFDPERRKHFWSALKEEMQVFASGTELPQKSQREWETFTVSAGTFSRK